MPAYASNNLLHHTYLLRRITIERELLIAVVVIVLIHLFRLYRVSAISIAA